MTQNRHYWRARSLNRTGFFSGHIDHTYLTQISVPNSILLFAAIEQGIIDRAIERGEIRSVGDVNKKFLRKIIHSLDVKMCSLDDELGYIDSGYDNDNNHLRPLNHCCIGRLLKLLGVPLEDKNMHPIEFPLYTQVAAEKLAKAEEPEERWLEYKAERLVDDWVKIMILSKGTRSGNRIVIDLVYQPDKKSATALYKDAEAAIFCIFPDLELDHSINPIQSDCEDKTQERYGMTFWQTKIRIEDGVERVRSHYSDPRVDAALR